MKILWISAWFPYPPVNGSKIRVYNLLKVLKKYHEIEIISFVREGEEVDMSALERLGINSTIVANEKYSPNQIKAIFGFFSTIPRALYHTYSKAMEEAINQHVEKFGPDLVIFSQLLTSVYGPISSIPCIIDDLESLIISDQWRNADTILLRQRYWLTWQKHKKYLQRRVFEFAGCFVASEHEKRLLLEIAPNYPDVYEVPNGVDIQNNFPTASRLIPGKLIYNGSLTYSANYDAIEYFLGKIMPRIQAEIDTVNLTITGSTLGVDVNKLPKSYHVEFTGYLPDIRPTFQSAWACVVPLRIGGGTRLKILEAMALGVPVVSTPKGAEGLLVTPEKDILIGEDDASFAHQVIRLFRDEDLRTELAANGRKLVESHYDWRKIGENFCKIIDEIFSNRKC